MSDQVNNHRLMEHATEGCESFLGSLFESNRRRLERMARGRLNKRLRPRLDASDVVQDTFVEILKKYPRYVATGVLPIELWFRLEVAEMLRRLHRSHLRMQARNAGREVAHVCLAGRGSDWRALAVEEEPWVDSASRATIAEENRILVRRALNCLAPHDREILVLRYLEKRSNRDVARALRISPTAACNRHTRALQRLQNVLENMSRGTWEKRLG